MGPQEVKLLPAQETAHNSTHDHDNYNNNHHDHHSCTKATGCIVAAEVLGAQFRLGKTSSQMSGGREAVAHRASS